MGCSASRNANSEANMETLKEIEFDELKKEVESGESSKWILIDVRNRGEVHESGTIIGSYNIPLPEVSYAFSGMPDSDFKGRYGFEKPQKDSSSTLVVFCLSGKRASKGVNELHEKGYNGARLYSGSFSDWLSKDGPISKAT